MPIYNKLVRDKIPEIIQESGKKFNIRTLEMPEYKEELVTKLAEESAEYTSANSDQDALEELADILEIIKALSALHGTSLEYLEALRKEKAGKRGGFEDRMYLVDVQD